LPDGLPPFRRTVNTRHHRGTTDAGQEEGETITPVVASCPYPCRIRGAVIPTISSASTRMSRLRPVPSSPAGQKDDGRWPRDSALGSGGRVLIGPRAIAHLRRRTIAVCIEPDATSHDLVAGRGEWARFGIGSRLPIDLPSDDCIRTRRWCATENTTPVTGTEDDRHGNENRMATHR
jgi:hypothetical protein